MGADTRERDARSDVEARDRLLHPDLLAVGPDGQLSDKEADHGAWRVIAAHIAWLSG